MGLFGLSWFQPGKDQLQRREMLIAIILAVALALVANRTLSMALPFRTRPMYAVGANTPTFEWYADLENWSSFPSDNATYLFAIAAGLWWIAPGWGLFFGAFGACAASARVFLGIHYPSDAVVGALIGIAIGLLVVRKPLVEKIGLHLLAWEAWQPGYFYGALFLVTAELGSGFPNTRRIGVAIVHLFVGFKTCAGADQTSLKPSPQSRRKACSNLMRCGEARLVPFTAHSPAKAEPDHTTKHCSPGQSRNIARQKMAQETVWMVVECVRQS